MKISKFLVSPLFVVLVSISFLFLVTGCSRTVTKYDADGKPYSDTEPDPWGTIGALILGMFVLGAIAGAASSAGGGSFLPVEHRIMLAYAGNRGIVYDAHSGIFNPVKCFRLIDSEGNLISEHLIDVDKLLASKPVVNISDAQVSVKVDETMLKKIVNELAKSGALKSMPTTIKTGLSFSADEKNTLRLESVSIPPTGSHDNGISELLVISEKGAYKVSTALNENPDTGQFSVTVSQLN